ncbi:MAG TPA: hypothetical protein VMS22_16945 [Candidatus Eisenbacteria bacterium]|nr:hypothetical protein [Candidatus Eisenbacteria bacterium]
MKTSDLAHLVQLVLGTTVAEPVVARLHERAEGDPRVVLDVLRHALDHADGPIVGLEAAVGNGIAPPTWLFRREGDYWMIRYADRVVRLHDTAGLRYLAVLLANPGTAIDAVAIAAHGRRRTRGITAEQARLAVTKSVKVAIARLDDVHPDLAEHFRTTIRRGYRCTYRPDAHQTARWSVG